MPPIHLSTTFERGGWLKPPTVTSTRARRTPTARWRMPGGAGRRETSAAFIGHGRHRRDLPGAGHARDHVIFPDDVYFGTSRLLREVLGPWELDYSVVDMTDLDAARSALRPQTRLVWVETPSNPLLKITDIAAVAEIAHAAGARCAVDNTWPSPAGQQPLALGADLIMHATTKYLGGHSDPLGGAVVRENDAFFQRIRLVQTVGGAVPSPFDCWLLMRSIRTLPYRMRATPRMRAPPSSWPIMQRWPWSTIRVCPPILAMRSHSGR